MTSLEPPADRVIVRVHAPDTETAFGLALPEQAQADSSFATVLAVGNGPQAPGADKGVRIPLCSWHSVATPGRVPVLIEGDVVVMPKFNGTVIEYDGEEVVSILASEILAVVT